MVSYINNWPGRPSGTSSSSSTSSSVQLSAVQQLILVMFIEEMVAVRAQQAQTDRLEEGGQQEAYRRWQQYNQETLLL